MSHPLVRRLPRLAIVGALAVSALLAGIGAGSTDLSWLQVLQGILRDDGSASADIVRHIRLPRVASAFSVGALLGMAGALFQVLVRNPLADPYIMGTAGGAAAAYLMAALAGLPAPIHPLAAFAGALASTAIVAWLARLGRVTDSNRLLLTGVMLAAGWGALVTLLLSLAPSTRVPGLLFWLMGDLNHDTGWATAAIALATGLPLVWLLAASLNLLAFGTTGAGTLGVAVTRIQVAAFALASLFTAIAVSVAGPIGFVGLVAPHLMRRTVSTDHRLLLPASALAGGALLVLADALARTVMAPRQLPVGVLTALIGVPLFLMLLSREGRRHG